MTSDTDVAFPPDANSSVVRIPVTDAETVSMRYSPLQSRSEFAPGSWDRAELSPTDDEGWYELDLTGLDLPDGRYEYEFVVERGEDEPVGSDGQVVVVANLGPESFEAFEIPWTWGKTATERGTPLRDGDLDLSPDEELARVDLAPHQVRVLVT